MTTKEAIAIVGIGCRLPGGVSNPEALLEFVSKNGDGIVPVPPDRWSTDRFASRDQDAPGRGYVFSAGFLEENVYEFDPVPFGLSPRETEYLDPQQRLLLESAHDALEDAGLFVGDLKGSGTGVYIGAFNVDVRDMVSLPSNRKSMSAHTATGASHTILSNRLSYTFDFHGPSFTVDTACSSSLVTVHYACRDLLDGVTDLALAGGVNVMLSPVSSAIMCKGHFLAPDGRSKAFDAAADGYGRGEGAGIVVLKRLGDAVRDGDRIYAVILASGVNQDGKTDGMPMPNGDAQAELCRKVVERAGVDPNRVGYVEAHGTGTRAGDPIEVRALASVYCGDEREVPLAVGSIKSNVGHLEAAAGVTGLIKTALSLNAGRILPLRELKAPNPDIPFEKLKVRVPTIAEAWAEGTDRVAAVNSFGYGGTNAHAILRAPLAGESSREGASNLEEPKYAFLSAHDEGALRARAKQLAEHPEFAEAVSVLAHRREALPTRAFAFSTADAPLRQVLENFAAGKNAPSVVVGKTVESAKLLFVYTGMGPQWLGMGQELYDFYPVFREAAKEADAAFARHSGWSVLAVMLGDESARKMKSNSVAQPANFVLQVALTKLLLAHGVRPEGYLGHSVGELTAAWASGALSLEVAAELAFKRSDIQQKAAGRGTMAALAVSQARAADLCRRYGDVSIAAINGAESVALAGGHEALDAIVSEISAENRFARKMQVEVAYHSHHMENLRAEFFERLGAIRGVLPAAPLYSTARGELVREPCHDAQYWWENARNPVLLHDALRKAFADGYTVALEVGPHPVLAESIMAAAREVGSVAQCLHTQRRKVDGTNAFLTCLGGLYAADVSFDRRALVAETDRRVLLPYPFQRKRYWFESREDQDFRLGRENAHAFLDEKAKGAGERWSVELAGPRFAWIADHRVQNAVVFPGAAYIETAIAVSAEKFGEDFEHVVEDLELMNPLVFSEGTSPSLEISLSEGEFQIASLSQGGSTLHARARLSGRSKFRAEVPRAPRTTGLTPLDPEALYEGFSARGLDYGPEFRRLEWVGVRGETIVATLSVPEVGGYWVFPGTLDSAFQALLTNLPSSISGAVVPVSVRSVRVAKRASGRLTMAGTTKFEDGQFLADFVLYDERGEPVLAIDGLSCRPVNRSEGGAAKSALLHEKRWVEAKNVGKGREGAFVLVATEGEDQAVGPLLDARGKFRTATFQDLGNTSTRAVFFVPREGDPTAEFDLCALTLFVNELVARGETRLTVVTRGGHGLVEGEAARPAHFGVVGFTRVVMTEYPHLDARIVDVGDDLQPEALVEFLCSGSDEEEVAIRDGKVMALRLARAGRTNETRRGERRAPESGEHFELYCERPGRIDSLCYRPRHFSKPLGESEVEIEVSAASLNFKDVMKALGMLDEVALHRTYLGKQLGLDAAGRVVAVGSAVVDLKVGDDAFVFAPGSLASRVRADSRFVVPVAKGHSAAAACTYGVFQTVWFGLHKRAGLARDESILIHSAAGGVGLAAIQLAKHLGARIFATAGTEEKRELLRAMGIEHVYDSRTLDFSREVLRDTGGRGVDVVLNSLAGEAVLHNIAVLAPGGRMVELGKQDIAKSAKVSLLPFNRATSLIAVDMDRMATENPAYFKPVALEVCAAFESGIFSPLPTTSYAADEAIEAFRSLASGAQIGKIVLDFSRKVQKLAPGLTPQSIARADKTYLVVGGLGGFGLRTARFLAERGATSLVLASRRGTVAESERAELETIRRACPEVELRALDVTDEEAVVSLVRELASRAKPLGGIVHSAMVLSDKPIAELDAAGIRAVLRPKALGAWNLHLATIDVPLDYFVLYSSVSGLVGNAGQAAYAAANSFLDGLAAYRSNLGLAATAVQWGALGEVGIVSREGHVDAHLRSVGLNPIQPEVALRELAQVLEEGFVSRGVIDIDWARWMRTNPETRWNRLEMLREGESGEVGRLEVFAGEVAAIAEASRATFVTERVAIAVAPIFKLEAGALDVGRSLKDLGMDSLMALEVQAALEERIGVELSTMELLAGRSIQSLSQSILKRLDEPTKGTETSTAGTLSEIPSGDLAEYFLARICVQRPYFALEDVRFDGDWVSGLARPVAPLLGEMGAVSLAEGARHTAIVGSCAARLRDSREGRIYYPVRSARLVEVDESRGTPLSQTIVRARCIDYDVKASVATAEVQMSGRDGRLVCAFEVTYHIIPEAEFAVLFAERAQATHEAEGGDPYGSWRSLGEPKIAGNRYVFELGVVDPSSCLGHFVGYPAYPVSIMARDAMRAISLALAVRAGGRAPRIRTVGGDAGTNRFAFAGETLTLVVERLGEHSSGETWRASFVIGAEECAWFEMHLQIEGVLGRAHSAVVGPPDEIEMLG